MDFIERLGVYGLGMLSIICGVGLASLCYEALTEFHGFKVIPMVIGSGAATLFAWGFGAAVIHAVWVRKF